MIEPEANSINQLIAAMAGSLSGLAFMPWKEMDWKEVALTVFVGLTCAYFVAPWISFRVWGVSTDTARTVAMVTYVTGVGAHILLPRLIKVLSATLGDKA